MQRLSDERGAVLVFVVLMIVALIGFGGIAVDAGALYQEHRELQNAADAGALAVAQDCAAGTSITHCSAENSTPDVRAEYYGDENAEDGTVEAAVDLTAWSDNKVAVNTSTIDGSNAPGQLTVFFARVFGVNTASTTASATARWGNVQMGSIDTLPLTISQCEYDAALLAQGGRVNPVPSTTAPETFVYFHAGNGAADETSTASAPAPAIGSSVGSALLGAAAGGKDKDKDEPRPSPSPNPSPSPSPSPSPHASPSPDPGNGNGNGRGGNGGGGSNDGGPSTGDCAAQAGQDSDGDGRLPGGFGWLHNNGSCQALVTNNEIGADPGVSPDNTACSPETLRDKILNKVVLLPIFVDVDEEGGVNGTYTAMEYAAFYVTGYDFTGQYKEPAGMTCQNSTTTGNSSTCIRGWFTDAVTTGGTIGTGPGLGVKSVALDD